MRVVALCLALAACQPYDPGGDVIAASNAMFAARTSGAPIEVRGVCLSACALKLGSGAGLCVDPAARVGVHEVRQSPDTYERGKRDGWRTAFFAALLPRCVARLFNDRQAFDGPNIMFVSGRQILGACVDMRSCARG